MKQGLFFEVLFKAVC